MTYRGNPNAVISSINTAPSSVVVTGTTSANGSNQATATNPTTGGNGFMVTNLSSIVGIAPGMTITGSGIPANTIVMYVDSLGSFLYMNKSATAGASGVSLTIGGNPIAVTRLDGQTPAVFQVSAAFITATGTSLPWEDLQFDWNFGDNSATTGTRTFTRPTDGKTVDPNIHQSGPEAAYIYDTAGTYTITLTITGKAASGYITATATQSVTVTAFAPTAGQDLFFDSVNGNDGNIGTAALPKQTLTALRAALSGKVNVRVNLANGSSWSDTANLLTLMTGTGQFFNTGVRIVNYNPSLGGWPSNSNKPILSASGSALRAIFMDNGSGSSPVSKFDVVIAGLNVQASGASASPMVLQLASYNADMKSSFQYLHMLDTDMIGATGSAFAGMTGGVKCNGIFGAGFWNCTFATTGSGATVQGTNAIIRQWLLLFGCTFSGDGTNSGTDHFFYPEVKSHSLYKWNTFSPGGVAVAGRNNNINTSYDSVNGTLEYAEYNLISENAMGGTVSAFKAQPGVNVATAVWNSATTGNNFTLSANFSFNNAFPVVGASMVLLTSSVDGYTIPAGFTSGQVYYVVNSVPASNTVQLSATLGGAAITISGSGTALTQISLFRNFVAERNLMRGFSSSQVAFTNAITMTVRDNRALGNTTGRPFFSVSQFMETVGSYTVYRNQVCGDGPSNGKFFYFLNGTNWLLPQTLTDNQVCNVDAVAPMGMSNFVFSQLVATGSLVDRNVWWGPNGGLTGTASATGAWYDNGTVKTFSQWRASGFDINGTVADLGLDPYNWTIPPTAWAHFGSTKRALTINA